MGWHWHQLYHMQIICTLLHIDNNASAPPLSLYRTDALPAANQQHKSTEGTLSYLEDVNCWISSQRVCVCVCLGFEHCGTSMWLGCCWLLWWQRDSAAYNGIDWENWQWAKRPILAVHSTRPWTHLTWLVFHSPTRHVILSFPCCMSFDLLHIILVHLCGVNHRQRKLNTGSLFMWKLCMRKNLV